MDAPPPRTVDPLDALDFRCCPECGGEEWRFKGRARYCLNPKCGMMLNGALGMCPSPDEIYGLLAPAIRATRPPLEAKKGYRGPPHVFRYWGAAEWIDRE